MTGELRALRREALRSSLAEESRLDADYMFLSVLSCVIATLGLIADSAAAVIGAMIVAPLMLPIRGLAAGALWGDVRLFRSGVQAVVGGSATAVAVAAALAMVVGPYDLGHELSARIQPTLLDLGIALAAGVVSAIAKLRARISDAVAGTAIAVALMPPLCTVGICLALGRWPAASGALLLFLTNLLGIALACMASFALAGLAASGQRTLRAVGGTLLLTATVVVPLSLSLYQLMSAAQLTALVRQALVSRTITIGRHARLTAASTNWSGPRPVVRLSLQAKDPPTPRQVALLEAFLAAELGHPFELIIEVSRVQEVRAEPSASPAGP